MLMAGINISGRTATNLLLAGELETLTPDDIALRIYGSKIVILLEQSMLVLTWGIKVGPHQGIPQTGGLLLLTRRKGVYDPDVPPLDVSHRPAHRLACFCFYSKF